MPDSNPKSSQRPASLFIDDSAEERSKVDHTESEDVDSVHSSDKAFINDASDLSVYSKDDNNMDITVNDDSDLSSLSQDERDEDRPMVDATAHSDEEVIVVETPSRVKQSRASRGKRVVKDLNSEDEATAIQPDDSMFTKRGSVKASTLPPPMATRASKARSSPSTPSASTRGSGAVLVLPNAKQGSRKLANVGLGNGAQKAEGQPKIFLRVQKSRDTEVKSAEQHSSSPMPSSTEQSERRRSLSPTTSSQPDMKTAMESVLSEMLDSRLEGIAQSLMLQLAPMLMRAASPKTEPTNKVIPVQPEDPVDVPGVIDDHMDVTVNNEMQVAQSVSPSSAATVEGITVAPLPNPTQAVVLDNSASKAFGAGAIQWADPVTPPRKESKATFDSRPFSQGLPFAPDTMLSAVVSPTTRVAVRQYPDAGHPLPLQSGFSLSPEKPSGSASVDVKGSSSNQSSPARDNLARMFASNRLDSSKRVANEGQPETSSPKRTKYHEDLLTYPVLFAEPDVCEVSDDKLQDEAIKDVYKGLCKLPGGRKLLPSFVRSQSGEDWSPGGRLAFSYWFKALNEVSGITLFNAMSFKRSGRYFAPQRESPDRVLLAQEPGTSPYAYKLYIGNEYAVGVTPGLCFESYVVEPFRSSASPPRYRKFLSVLFHNQDWERFVSFMCCVFDRKMLHTQMTGKALQFSTKMNTVEAVKQTSMLDRLNKYMDSPKQSGSSGRRPSPTNKFSLEYTDDVPVYDARHLDFDFTADLPKMATDLPLWPHKEIPEGSFVTVGYTVSTYKGMASGHTDKVLHLGCNLQWVIVCGTSASKDADE